MLYFEMDSKDMAKVVKLCKKVIDKKAVLPVLSSLKIDVFGIDRQQEHDDESH